MSSFGRYNPGPRNRRMARNTDSIRQWCMKYWNMVAGSYIPNQGTVEYQLYLRIRQQNPATNEQIQCVESDINKHLLIDAVAGSGKTFVIINRILYTLSDPLVRPEDLLVLTYTNNAVNEIKNRLKEKLASFQHLFVFNGLSSPLITTFHKYCQRYIIHSDEIMNEKTYLKIIKKIKKEEITGTLTLQDIDHSISETRYKIAYEQLQLSELEEISRNLYRSYIERVTKAKHNQNSDYLGVLIRFLNFITTESQTARFKQAFDFYHLVLDEMQDMNLIMLKIVEKMIETGMIVTFAGDKRQKIYSYSGLSIDMAEITNLALHHHRGINRELSRNFRCHENIHKAAMQLFEEEYIEITYHTFDFRVFSLHTPGWISQCTNAVSILQKIIEERKSVACLFRTNIEKKKFYKNYVKGNTNLVKNLTYESSEADTLSTIHSSKGLEFDVVLVFTTIEMNIPKYSPREAINKFNGSIKEKTEEEKRILYVALTRAKKLVILLVPRSVADESSFQWQYKRGQPSNFISKMNPFVDEIHDSEEFVRRVLSEKLQ